MKLNSRNATSVRQKIQASQLINRLQSFVDGAIELNGAQVKAACYLISQAIGSPPQEVTGEVTVTAHIAVHALVARLGADRARQVLELQAPGLIALMPGANGLPVTLEGEADSADDSEQVAA